MLEIIRSALLSEIPGLEHGFTTSHLPAPKLKELEESAVTLKQVHKDGLVWVTQKDDQKREADAVATVNANVTIGVRSGDCTPVLVVAVKSRRPQGIMAIHAGWRGTALGIVVKSLRSFQERLGAMEYFAAIGPCIGKESFEVGQEVVDAFPDSEKRGLAHFLRLEDGKKKYLFDLGGENRRQLLEAAINAKLKIDFLEQCTYQQKDLYPSFRRDREKAGRIFSYLSFDNLP